MRERVSDSQNVSKGNTDAASGVASARRVVVYFKFAKFEISNGGVCHILEICVESGSHGSPGRLVLGLPHCRVVSGQDFGAAAYNSCIAVGNASGQILGSPKEA
jgi:hypothetical protein